MLPQKERDLPPFVSGFCHFSYQNLKQTTQQTILKWILNYYAEATISMIQLKEERQDTIFSSCTTEKSNNKKNFNGQQYVILIPCRSVLPLLQRYFDQKMGGQKKRNVNNCGFLEPLYLGTREISPFGFFFFFLKTLPPFPKIINSLSVAAAVLVFSTECRAERHTYTLHSKMCIRNWTH